MNTITNAVGTKDWIKLTEGMALSAHIGTESLSVSSEFIRDNLEGAPGKASRKRNIPLGENIRDAIQSIKNNS
jgi:hypothetical protein